MTSYCTLQTSLLGDLLLIANPTQLIGVYFSDCGHAPAAQNGWALNPRQPVLQQASTQLQEYLSGHRTRFSLPLHGEGTPFQREIWRQIARIPLGQTITYTDLAQRAGVANAIRAVGTATGRNPLSLIIPCHRVVGKNGALCGYAGGLDRKKRLLEIETKTMPQPTASGQELEAFKAPRLDFELACKSL